MIKNLSASDLKSKFVPILAKAIVDKIPNVRFCAARTMMNIRKDVSADEYKSLIIPLAKQMSDDKDLEV